MAEFHHYMAIYTAPYSDEIPAGVMQVGGETLLSMIHTFPNCTRKMEELPGQWKESVTETI
jgi:hypothetical protein